MIFTMDVGNTNIKTALFKGKEMVKYWRISTSKTDTSDEYGILLSSLFAHEKVDMREVEGVAISSVVPTFNFTLEHMCKNYQPDPFSKYQLCFYRDGEDCKHSMDLVVELNEGRREI